MPDVTARRLEALSSASGRSMEELALEAVGTLTSSVKSRRAIVKARASAGKTRGAGYSLADLGWIDGYTGQTIDELLVFESTESVHWILFTIEDAIRKKLEAEGQFKMTGVMLMVLSVMALEREVNNGGYDQFLRNSSRRFAPRIVADLARIGCLELADLTQQALDALGLESVTVPAVEAAMSLDNDERDRRLERCDIAFYERAGPAKRLLSYLKAHADGVQI